MRWQTMRQKRRWIFAAALLVIVAAVSYFRLAPRGQTSQAGWLRGGSASRAAAGPCLDFHDATRHTGENGCVSGRVLRTYTSTRGNTFLDFCEDFRNCSFGSVIFASDSSKFRDLSALEGEQIEIRGLITSYQGRAEIIIHDPHQIRTLR